MISDDEIRMAQSELDTAVDRFIAQTQGDVQRVTTAYILVSHQQGWDDEGKEVSSYIIAYPGGSLPDHVALGLLSVASDTIRETGRWGREE